MIKKFKIPSMLLLILAYPTETLADMEYTKQWFRDRKEYAENHITVSLSEAQILPNTQLSRRKEEYEITAGEIPQEWDKIGLTNDQRKQYNNEVSQLLVNLGFKHFEMEANNG